MKLEDMYKTYSLIIYYYQILQGQPAQILSQEEYNRLY